MPILAGDIKIMAAQVMADVPEGGGAPTSTEIVDGQSNGIFDDISELDRAGGRVSIRKAHVHVQTPTRDGFFGTNLIVAEPPADPLVSVTLFSTENTFDRREVATARVESYLAAGPVWDGYLWDNHIAGMRTVALLQRPSATPPVVGQTLVLVQDEGLVTQKLQYVRATKVTLETRNFTENISGGSAFDYPARVATLEISDPLRTDFAGSAATRYFKPEAGKSIVRATIVADAGAYVGVVPLAQDIALGDVAAKIESIYTQLVPSAQTEIALLDKSLSTATQPYIPARADALSYTITSAQTCFKNNGTLQLLTGCLPGTFTGPQTTTDDGQGNILRAGTTVGTIDYASGKITFGASAGYTTNGTQTISYRPAVAIANQAHTAIKQVTAENRGYTWIFNLNPLPSPRGVEIAYMAGGQWISLTDDGAGALTGTDAAQGIGTINYVTGTASLTCGALPDVGSAIIATWGSPAHYTVKAGATADIGATPGAGQSLQLAYLPIVAGSISLSYTAGGQTYTATDSAGVISGGGISGTIDYLTGVLTFDYNARLPDAASSIQLAYNSQEPALPGEPLLQQATVTAAASMALGAAVTPGSLSGTLQYPIYNVWHAGGGAYTVDLYPVQIADNGLGAVTVAEQAFPPLHLYVSKTGAKVQAGVIGTIDYATGEITISNNLIVNGSAWGYTIPGGGWSDTSWPATIATGEPASFSWRTPAASGSTTARVGSLPVATVALDLVKSSALPIVPGTLIFTLAGNRYVDRNGLLYTSLDPATGAGVQAGSIDYATGIAALSHWQANVSLSPSVEACLVRYGQWTAAALFLRTAATPLRPSSLSLSVVTTDGDLITGTSNANGEIVGAKMRGTINYDTGAVAVEFGEMVGPTWVPQLVDPTVAKYNAVAYTYLPLDADILGLDPVRLPQDGRVPIFRTGGFVVVGNTQTTNAQTVANGQTINCGRVRLSRLRVIGANNATIQSGYTQDLDAGTVTFTDVSGYAQPVKIEHRIEDMAQVSDVQITGDLRFTRQLTHDYPASGSYVSSALIAGDLRARVSTLFDQATWTNTWADTVIGASATGTFNDVQYPPVVTNSGAVTERWAIQFTNTTAFNVIGEHVGVIANGNTSTDCAPNNPATGTPYFTLPALGWGGGWSAGNILRFNTVGAQFPVWIVRTVQQGPETVPSDSFQLLVRGDVDHP